MSSPGTAMTPKEVLLFLYEPNKKFLHVLVKLKDATGALAEVSRRVSDSGLNVLVGFTAAGKADGTGIWSFFAECGPGASAGKVKKALAGSAYVIGVSVNESEDGLLVDQMHYPLMMTPGREFIGLNTVTASSMFRRIVSEFGSGGSVIIYEEGLSVGREGGEFLRRIMGRDLLRRKLKLVGGLLGGWGWGKVESIETNAAFTEVRLKETGSFEAKASSGVPVCHFTRGMLAGFFEEVMGAPTKASEVSCMAQGAPVCEFLITRSPPAGR